MRHQAPKGSRVVAVVRGLAEDDGARLALGAAMFLAGPQLVTLAADSLVRLGVLRGGSRGR